MKIIIFIALIMFGISASSQKLVMTDDGKLIEVNFIKALKYKEAVGPGIAFEVLTADYSKNELLTFKTEPVLGMSFIQTRDVHRMLNEEGNEIGFYAYKKTGSKSFSLVIIAHGAGKCINEIEFRFRDGKSITLMNNSDTKYRNHFTQSFHRLDRKEKLGMLCTREVEIMNAITDNGTVGVTFTGHDSKLLMYSLRYFLDEIL
jgi:hypothetical protein